MSFISNFYETQAKRNKNEESARSQQSLMLMAKTNANHDISNIIFVDTIESTLCKYIHRIYI